MRLLVLDQAWQATGGVDTIRRFLVPALATQVDHLSWAAPPAVVERCLGGVDRRQINVLDPTPLRGSVGHLMAGLARRLPATLGREAFQRAARTAAVSHLRSRCRGLGITHVLEICVFRQPFVSLGRPTAGIVHDLCYPNRGSSPIDRIFRHWLAHADHLFADSSQTRAELLELRESAKSHVTVLPLPATPSLVPDAAQLRNRWRRREPVLYYPGVAADRKGHGILFAALGKLAAEGVPFHCYLSGHGTESITSGSSGQPWLPLVRERVEGLGWRPWPEVEELYAAADVVVLPSVYEGFGLPLSEALCRGKPVLASRLGPFEEQVKLFDAESQVRWFTPGDEDELQQVLAEVLTPGPTQFPVFDDALRKRLMAWNWDAYAASLLSTLRVVSTGTCPLGAV